MRYVLSTFASVVTSFALQYSIDDRSAGPLGPQTPDPIRGGERHPHHVASTHGRGRESET